MIEGVDVTPLRQIPDERGRVMHMLRRDWPVFTEFGEVYFSCIDPGAIKAWHRHRRMHSNIAVPVGRVRLVLYDDREDSGTTGDIDMLEIGPDPAEDYQLVSIPPGVWSGFMGMAEGPSLLVNCASILHDPDEADRRDPFDPDIPYSWT